MIESILKIINGVVKVRNSSGTIIDPATESTQLTQNTRIGDLTETAPSTDTASSGLNGRLQRIAQRLTSIISLLPSSLSNDRFKVEAIFASDYTVGSFGGLRVITTQNIFESLFSYDKQPLIWDETLSGGATSTFNSNTNSIDMVLPTTSGASVVRQTFRRVRYNPSRTVQFLAAATLGAPKANTRKRIGQFDSSDGIYFEVDGTTGNVCLRTSTSGSVVDTKIDQANWNIDKFDGTGPSGITIDFSKHNLFYIQYAFQGFGDIVFGFYANGRIRFCHRIVSANVTTTSFMKTAHLPARVEATNTGTSASSTTVSYNSVAMKNEGEDADREGQVRSYSDAPIKTVGTTTAPVLSIRLRSGFEKAIVDLIKTTIFVQTADEVVWSLHINSTLTGATFGVNVGYVNIDIGATAMTIGEELISGILSQARSSDEISENLLEQVNSLLGTSIAGDRTVITLGARSRSGTADVLSTVVWREFP